MSILDGASETLQDLLREAVVCMHLRGSDNTRKRFHTQFNAAERAEIWKDSQMLFVRGRDRDEDAIWLTQHGLAYRVIMLCKHCRDNLPSVRATDERLQVIAEKRELQRQEELHELHERFRSGETLYLCSDCEQVWGEDELVPVRECPHCEDYFSGEDGRNCEFCNRPFTRKVCDNGCPDCLGEDSCDEITDESQIPDDC